MSRDVFFWLQKINQEKNSETTVNVTYYEVQKIDQHFEVTAC